MGLKSKVESSRIVYKLNLYITQRHRNLSIYEQLGFFLIELRPFNHSCWRMACCPSPVLLPLQQFTISGYLNVKSHFDVEKVLVLSKVASHLLLQVADLILQSAYVVLVVSYLITKLVLHFTHLPQQSFILK